MKKLLTSLTIFVVFLSTFSMLTTSEEAEETKYWALLVKAGSELGFQKNADYMYHVIGEHCDFDGIYYLNSDNTVPGVNATATVNNTRSAIKDWLKGVSGPDDVIFIYFNMHGGGLYNNNEGYEGNMGGIEDQNGDEDDGWDERLAFRNKTENKYYYYLDDDLADDLNTLNGEYSTLILVTQSCFGGGVIDDLRASDRILMSATGETITAFMDLDDDKEPAVTDGYFEWSEVFIDALHGEDTYWNASHGVVHQAVPVHAGGADGNVSMLEAFKYTLKNDDATNRTFLEWLKQKFFPIIHPWAVPETPQIFGNVLIANYLWFPKKCVHLTALAEDQIGDALSSGDVYLNDKLVGYTGSIFHVSKGQHSVFVDDFWESGNTGYRYGFDHWEDGSVDNPRTMTNTVDMRITAYLNKVWCPGDVDSNGDVDIYDLGLLADAYGSTRGDPSWDSRCDFDADADIDIADFAILGKNYGNIYW